MDLDFFHFLAPINWKTNEGCMIDLNSKINRIFLSSLIQSFMATKNEDQTKYSHLSKVLKNVQKKSIYNQPKPYFFLGYCEVISG